MNYVSPIASHARELASLGANLTYNYCKTHTVNNNICALIALSVASTAAYKFTQAIYYHIKQTSEDAKPLYVKTGKILLTVGTFALGTLNPTLGWVIPAFLLVNKKLWIKEENKDASFTKHLILPIRAVGQGLASQIDSVKNIVSETLYGKSETTHHGILPIVTALIAFKPLMEQVKNIFDAAVGVYAIRATLQMSMPH